MEQDPSKHPHSEKFQELWGWLCIRGNSTGVTMSDIIHGQPKFYQAIRDQIAEMEHAYFEEKKERMDAAMERIKKIFDRAVGLMGKERGLS
jgi:hypothetical protein